MMTDEKIESAREVDEGSSPEWDYQHHGKGIPQPANEKSQDSSDGNTVDGQDLADISTANGLQARGWSIIYRLWNWKPKPARYDPENPPKFTIWLNVLFGFVKPPFGDINLCPPN